MHSFESCLLWKEHFKLFPKLSMLFATVFVKPSSCFLTKMGVYWSIKTIMKNFLNVTQSFKTAFQKNEIWPR